MIRTTKESPKYTAGDGHKDKESASNATTTMTTMTLSAQQAAARPKRSQQWLLAIFLVSIFMLLLARNQDAQSLVFETGGMEEVEVEQQESVTKPDRPIRQISVLGERNSGTRWTFE